MKSAILASAPAPVLATAARVTRAEASAQLDDMAQISRREAIKPALGV